MLVERQLRIRNAANSADALTITSVRGGTNPFLSGAPRGDGTSVDPRTGDSVFGVYTGKIIDVETGSMQRLITSQLEDADGRQQLGYRRAVYEERENGGAWVKIIEGVLTGLRLVTKLEWEWSVSDVMQAQNVSQLFAPASSTLITDFLTDWPVRGCVLGGPVIGAAKDAFGIADLGGWTMRVEASAVPHEYFLQPEIVYGPPHWIADTKTKLETLIDPINEAVGGVQQPLGNGAASPWDTIEDTQVNAWAWQGLTVLINGVPFKPLVADYRNTPDGSGFVTSQALLVQSSARGRPVMKVKSDGLRTLTDGARVRVRVLTVLPSEISPLYLRDHPIALLQRFWDELGIPYSTSACTAMTTLLGRDARYTMRITSAKAMRDMAGDICRAYGIGLRSTDGEIEPFDARLGRSPDDPLVTIVDADIIPGTLLPFSFDPTAAIKSIIFRAKRFIDQRSVPVHRNDATIVDGVAVDDVELVTVDADTGAVPFGDFTLDVDGMIQFASALYPTVRAYWVAVAQRVFDRWGRGGIKARCTLRRGGAGDALKLGDEFMLAAKAVPNHNYRILDNNTIPARAMQITRRTVQLNGYDVELDDSGVGGQPPATLPVVSIAASSDLPRTVAEVTITNAAALNTAHYGVRLQIAFTDDGSAAAPEQFTDLTAYRADHVPTGAIRLPPVIAGETVQIRARSEVPGSRPTNWGTAHKVTLTGIAAPTSLTATPDGADGSRCQLGWTVGSGASGDLADIFIRLSSETFSVARLLRTLNPGSTNYLLEGLDPSVDYIASVRHRDPATHDTSAETDVSFTAGATTRTLNPPSDPDGFSGLQLAATGLAQFDGIYGIAAAATEFPADVEIAEAIETGVGAGTYGSYATVGRMASVVGNWTLWQALAPNDVLRRRLKARHVKDGCTPSSYTDVVTVTPWTHDPLAAYPGEALLELRVSPLSPTASDRFAFRLTPRDPFPSGAADLDLDFDVEAGLVLYEYNTTTPAAPVSVASSSDNDYEAIRPNAGDGAKSTSWNVEKTGRRIGLSGQIVVPEQPFTTSGVPSIDSIGQSAAFTPCDGGGGFTLQLSVSNMPPSATYDLVWRVVIGTYAGTTGSVSGVVNGDIIGDGGIGPSPVKLCPGDTLRVTITAIVDGVTIAAGSNEFTV